MMITIYLFITQLIVAVLETGTPWRVYLYPKIRITEKCVNAALHLCFFRLISLCTGFSEARDEASGKKSNTKLNSRAPSMSQLQSSTPHARSNANHSHQLSEQLAITLLSPAEINDRLPLAADVLKMVSSIKTASVIPTMASSTVIELLPDTSATLIVAAPHSHFTASENGDIGDALVFDI